MGFKDILATIISVAPTALQGVMGKGRGVPTTPITTPPITTPPFNPYDPKYRKRNPAWERRDDDMGSRPLSATDNFLNNVNRLAGGQDVRTEAPPPVPESTDTLAAQTASAQDPASPRAGVMVTPGAVAPSNLDPSQFVSADMGRDGMLFVDPQKTGFRTSGEVTDFVAQNGTAPILGRAVDVGTRTNKGPVLYSSQNGQEVNASIVPTPADAARQAQLDQQAFPGSKQTLTDPNAVVAQRLDLTQTRPRIVSTVPPAPAPRGKEVQTEFERPDGMPRDDMPPPPQPGQPKMLTYPGMTTVPSDITPGVGAKTPAPDAAPAQPPATVGPVKPKTQVDEAREKVEEIQTRLETGYKKTPKFNPDGTPAMKQKRNKRGELVLKNGQPVMEQEYEYGKDYDQTRNWKDVARGFALAFAQGLKASNGDWKSALVSGLMGGGMSLYDPNFDNKLRDQFQLEQAQAKYDAALKTEEKNIKRQESLVGLETKRAEFLKAQFQAKKERLLSMPEWQSILDAKEITEAQAARLNDALGLTGTAEAITPKDWRTYKETIMPDTGQWVRMPTTGPGATPVPIVVPDDQGGMRPVTSLGYQIPNPAQPGQMMPVSRAEYLRYYRDEKALETRRELQSKLLAFRERREAALKEWRERQLNVRLSVEERKAAERVIKEDENLGTQMTALQKEMEGHEQARTVALTELEIATTRKTTLEEQYREAMEKTPNQVDQGAFRAAIEEVEGKIKLAETKVRNATASINRVGGQLDAVLRKRKQGLRIND